MSLIFSMCRAYKLRISSFSIIGTPRRATAYASGSLFPRASTLLAAHHSTKMMASWYVCPSSSRFHSSTEIDLLHDRVGLDLVTEAISDDLPVVQDGNPVGQLESNVHIMLDDQQCDGGIELLEQCRHNVGLGRRKP